jgi:GTP-binding protein
VSSQQTTSSENEKGETDTYYYSPNVPLSTEEVNQQGINDCAVPEATVDTVGSAATTHEYSFFDEAIIYVRAGSGGQGANTYKRIGAQQGPPDGGNGGHGGNVILVVDPSLNTLAGLTTAWRPNSYGGSGAAANAVTRRKSFRAENGGDGDRQFRSGRTGKNVVIRVPPGTVVEERIRNDDGDTSSLDDEKTKWSTLGSLTSDGPEELIVAKGGEGGEGTGVQKQRGVKRPRLPSTGGERKILKLTLKIVADVALVGVPNAGKSTFLAAVTRAKPKIANYPFTTVIPNLGVWVPSTNESPEEENTSSTPWVKGSGKEGLVLCDVPGLIAGAADGVGLGHAFLRHVERCHVILHLIDATSNDPLADYTMLNREIIKYGTGQLAEMPQVVVVNKIDALEGHASEDWEEGLRVKWSSRTELEEKLRAIMPHSRLMWMSAKERDGVEDLMTRLAAFVKKVKEVKES